MRLLERTAGGVFRLQDFTGKQIPAYAILSHTWHEDNAQEVKFQDVQDGKIDDKAGWRKLEFCAKRAEADGLRWCWIDTCCIDKRDAVELSYAINSMFRWYQKAARCYVYLSDVSTAQQESNNGQQVLGWESAFRNSRWHSRGWTMQELLAPSSVDFYSREGQHLGTRESLRKTIIEISGISEGALRREPLSNFSIRDRQSWAERRTTTLEEDIVYSLLGIFDVTMPLIYGEGKARAWRRLLNETHSSSGSEPKMPTFHLLPFPRNMRFTGREAELKELRRKLLVDRGCHSIALVGLGGAGKTQIALSLAYAVKNDRPEFSVFWLPALSMETFEQACGEIARKLQLQAGDEEDVKRVVQRGLSNEARGKWLMVIDNADNYDLMCGTQQSEGIMDFLPISDHGHILFTTRNHEVARGLVQGDVVEVEKMADEDALAFLQRSVPRGELLGSESVRRELLVELEYLPLAISQAAAYIHTKKMPVVEYLRLMRNTEQGLLSLMSTELRDGTRYRGATNAIATTWIVSFDEILQNDKDAADLLAFMSCIEWKAIPRSILPAPLSETELASAIGTLCAYSFITRRADGQQYDMHRLVHLATQIWLRHNGRLSDVRQIAIQQLVRVFPYGNYEDREIWRAYLPHAVRMNKHAEDSEDKSWLCLKIGGCLRTDGRYSEALMWTKEAQSWAARLTPDDQYRTWVDHDLGSAYHANGQAKEAIKLLEGAVAVRQGLSEDHPSRLSSQHQLATAYHADGRTVDAIELLEGVLAIRAKALAEDHPHRLASQLELGSAYLDNGRTVEAIELLEGVLAIRAKALAEDHPHRLTSQHELGSAYLDNGRVEDAIELLEGVVAIRTKALPEDHPDRLASDSMLARAYLDNGRVEDAIELLEGVAIHTKALPEDHPDRLASDSILARAYLDNGRVKDAIELLDDVVAIHKQALPEDNFSRLASQRELARAYAAVGRRDEAVYIITHVAERTRLVMRADHPSRLKTERLLADIVGERGDSN